MTGRADVILDHEGGVPTALAIVDYKTSTTGAPRDHALQLQVYADAGRREGLDVRGAYVHDLKAAKRESGPGRSRLGRGGGGRWWRTRPRDPRARLRAEPRLALPTMRGPDCLPHAQPLALQTSKTFITSSP